MSARILPAMILLILAATPLASAVDRDVSQRLNDPLVPAGKVECAKQVIAPVHNLAAYRCEPFERALMTLGHRNGWKRVAWRKDLHAALADARRLEKPVAVVLMLNEYSQKDAGFS